MLRFDIILRFFKTLRGLLFECERVCVCDGFRVIVCVCGGQVTRRPRGPHSLVPQQSPTKAPRLNVGLVLCEGCTCHFFLDKQCFQFCWLFFFSELPSNLILNLAIFFASFFFKFQMLLFSEGNVVDLSCRPCGNVCAKI